MADSASDSAGTAEPSAEQAENATADGLGGGDLAVESSTVTWVVGFLILCAAGGMALAWRRHQRRKPIDPFMDMLTRPKYYIKLPPEREVFLDARDAFNPVRDWGGPGRWGSSSVALGQPRRRRTSLQRRGRGDASPTAAP